MTEILSVAAGLLVTIPLAGYLIMFIFSKQLTGNHRKSVQLAIDFSTLLFIFSVHFLIIMIWGKSFLWLIMLILIFLAVIFVLIHWKLRQEIDFARVFKGYWRFNFLLFFFVYLVLIIVGLYQRISWLVA
ncbi:DUF3397 domain-containing protein [Bacillus sp. FJAT-27251]|uniref:DUF3397 domain-containing protein n=1 Tax=Bacillus sp. FJAT-27251 TaxID=1684142 RepID=UPI0006A7C896|nr:DUF3397 domain-containing protein [Bacillus sp. FJAT-27251]